MLGQYGEGVRSLHGEEHAGTEPSQVLAVQAQKYEVALVHGIAEPPPDLVQSPRAHEKPTDLFVLECREEDLEAGLPVDLPRDPLHPPDGHQVEPGSLAQLGRGEGTRTATRWTGSRA